MPYANEPPRDDNPPQYSGDDPVSDDSGDVIPASVAFMEMMRQAAARNQAQRQSATPPPVEPPAAPQSPPKRSTTEIRRYSASASPPAPPPIAQDTQATGSEPNAPITRVRQRRSRRRQRATFAGGALRLIIIIPLTAVLIATIFAWFTPPTQIDQEVREQLSADLATSNFATFQPSPQPTPNWLKQIGIVSGHRGGEIYDPGAVCTDANGNAVRPNENDINFSVAERVVNNLRNLGYTVDLLDEFDPRLQNYQGAALVSIHANTCREWPGGEVVSGFLIAAPEARASMRGNDELLVGCIAQYYGAMTSLERRPGVTRDMTDYHNFREIHPQTPAAIIELGFMRADWELLSTQPDLMAQAVTNGILCFVDPALSPPVPGATPLPGA